MAPSHYLNQWWNIVIWTLRNKLQWNVNSNSNICIEENTFENVICEMLFILSQPQCVNTFEAWTKWPIFYRHFQIHFLTWKLLYFDPNFTGPIKKLSPSIMLSKSIMWIKEKQTDRYTWGHFVYASSQWEVTLQCNVVTHWLGTFTKWSLSAGNPAENPLFTIGFSAQRPI